MTEGDTYFSQQARACRALAQGSEDAELSAALLELARFYEKRVVAPTEPPSPAPIPGYETR